MEEYTRVLVALRMNLEELRQTIYPGRRGIHNAIDRAERSVLVIEQGLRRFIVDENIERHPRQRR
jgi:hypothetical protein